MRVLVVTSLYPPHALGGYEKSCQDVVDRWIARGHEVDVLTTSTRFADLDEVGGVDDADQPHVRRTLEWYWANHQILRPGVRRRIAIERGNQHKLGELLEQRRPDVVSFWAMGGMSLGLITTCIERTYPLALVMEDDWLVYAPEVDGWTSSWSRRPRWLRDVASQLLG
ncbi:MAG TPA: glycosyltransferase, partial [Mycobacteriales bacterium]|nr:glycosyltransferase [Mycobacteriales bacterium]